MRTGTRTGTNPGASPDEGARKVSDEGARKGQAGVTRKEADMA